MIEFTKSEQDQVSVTIDRVMNTLEFIEVIDAAATERSDASSQWYFDGTICDRVDSALEVRRRKPVYDLVEQGIFVGPAKLREFFLKQYGFDTATLRSSNPYVQGMLNDLRDGNPTDYTLASVCMSYAGFFEAQQYAPASDRIAAYRLPELGRTLDLFNELYNCTRETISKPRPTKDSIKLEHVVSFSAFKAAAKNTGEPLIETGANIFDFQTLKTLVSEYFPASRSLALHQCDTFYEEFDTTLRMQIEEGVRNRNNPTTAKSRNNP